MKRSIAAGFCILIIGMLWAKEAAAMELTSGAFEPGQAIPRGFSCEGEDASPPLAWSGVPQGTKSFALIADDPDAPGKTWVHWVVWNIPAAQTDLPIDASRLGLPAGAAQGMTDFGRPGYGGPCPPGGTHRYFFKLYALDTMLRLPDLTTKLKLLDAMKGHVLAEAQLVGTYSRYKK